MSNSFRQQINSYMTKLADRSTEQSAFSALQCIITDQSLTAENISAFIALVSSVTSADRSSFRRHSLRLLSLIAATCLPLNAPRLLSAALKRVRDPDTSVRAALVETIRSVAKSNCRNSNLTLLKPLYECLTHEQDVNAQIASALCLVAVVEESDLDPEMRGWIRKIVPKLVTLVKSNAFKGKSALVELIGTATTQDGVLNENLVELVVNCLVGSLKSEDWRIRKASSEALVKIGVSEQTNLGKWKDECILVFEARRFDKVRIVRDSMNRMVEVWKNIPSVGTKDSEVAQINSSQGGNKCSVSLILSSNLGGIIDVLIGCIIYYILRKTEMKSKFSASSLPLADATPKLNVKKKSVERLSLPSLTRKNIMSKNSGRKVRNEVSNGTPASVITEEKNAITMCESRRLNFDNKLDVKSSSRVVPCLDSECSDVTNVADNVKVETCLEQKNSDLSAIRNQLLKIEKQQSGLLDLVQKLMGSSQTGITSLETRVQSIELTLDEISRDLATSSRPVLINEPALKCCHLPGAEYLTPKYWRRSAGGRYSLSANPQTSGMRIVGDQTYRQRARTQNNFVNPLAGRANTEVLQNRMGCN